jgi:hypothetical protein
MAFSVKYVPLFKADILHHYFLNKGETEFSSMNDDEKAKQLDIYNIHNCLSIFPTSESHQQINGHNLVFKNVNTGFTVWTKVDESDDKVPFVSLDDDLSFTFVVQIKDSNFYNYTELDMDNAGRLYYLSNRRLFTEPGSFPLLNEAGGNKNVDETFILSDVGANAELIALEVNEKENLLGIIRIFMKADIGSLNVTNVQGKIRNPYETFEMVYENRKTIWRYFFDNDQQVKGSDDVKKENGDSKILITKKDNPLTQTGFISVELDGTELPNPSARLVKPGASNKYYSEIYM